MNHLYYGDNLTVLRDSIADESVDLIYLDPPFNSNANYNVLFRSPTGDQSAAQIEAFTDTWHWGEDAEDAFQQVRRSGHTDVATMLEAMRSFLGTNDMMAYLTMMAVRLIELHRVLKPTGSLYLHCDPTASHYLKILLDAVFGKEAFKNEIIWRRTGAHNHANRYGPIHDTILFFAKTRHYRHNAVFTPYLKGHVDAYFKRSDSKGRYWTNSLHGAGTRNGESGRIWRGYDPTAVGRHWAVPGELVLELGIDPDLPQHRKLDLLADAGVIDFPEPGSRALPTYRQYLQGSVGQLLQDIWAFQPHTNGVLNGTSVGVDEDVRWISPRDKIERLGYPTQKPVGLLERIIAASSNPGDVVLDPFCGCGTTIHAAEKLGRQWIGIDVTHLAVGLIERRIREAFPTAQFKVHGTPQDLAAAQDWFDRDDPTKKEFEKWAVSLIGAQPWRAGKKGADGGIDGRLSFGKTGVALVSVKGGRDRQRNHIDQLNHVVTREKADIGVFLTLHPPTKPMLAEAAGAGQFTVEGFDPVPRIQIVTIEDAMRQRERAVRIPLARDDAFRKPAREEDQTRQSKLDL
ncbi:MAG: site-specific DNA-methyltransferase [Paracoccus denitrificans]|nr:MAG: site-specific DNA-methyltransferase [Paracoccus denitrificans]PZO86378.1 MAG: site-specific DNA-methyltransferase [Paracoccus denitrificans]